MENTFVATIMIKAENEDAIRALIANEDNISLVSVAKVENVVETAKGHGPFFKTMMLRLTWAPIMAKIHAGDPLTVEEQAMFDKAKAENDAMIARTGGKMPGQP